MTTDAPLTRNQKYAITRRWMTFKDVLYWREEEEKAFRGLLSQQLEWVCRVGLEHAQANPFQEVGGIPAFLALVRRAHAWTPDYDARRAVIAVWEGLDPGVQTRLRHAAHVAGRAHSAALRRERLAAALAGDRGACSVWDILEEALDPSSHQVTDDHPPDERRRQFRVVR